MRTEIKMNPIYRPSIGSKDIDAALPVDAQAENAETFAPPSWMRGEIHAQSQPLLNANQLTSLSAMIAYIAARSGRSEFRIERDLADRFSIANAKLLSAHQFENAIRYLADLVAG